MRFWRPYLSAIIATSIAYQGAARADIYMYVDDSGVSHLSNVPVDDKFAALIHEPPAKSPSGDHPVTTPGKSVLVRSANYEHLIASAARKHRVEPELVRAILMVESGGDPKAVSSQGAAGLMQLMPATAKQYGVANVFDPEQNIAAGTHYLRDLIDRYDADLELVLSAYNAGSARVEEHGRQVPHLKETMDYVPRVLGFYSYLRTAPAFR
jgi:soluble lytic murein transglycosylase-like protein